jgi:hypothetical protein
MSVRRTPSLRHGLLPLALALWIPLVGGCGGQEEGTISSGPPKGGPAEGGVSAGPKGAGRVPRSPEALKELQETAPKAKESAKK